MPKLLRLEEAASAAGINPRTIRRRVAAGEIPVIIDPRDRRRKLIRITDLRKYVGEVGLKQAF